MEDHERAVVARVWQGVDVTLAAMQPCTGQDFRQVEPGFPDHAGQAEREEMFGDFCRRRGHRCLIFLLSCRARRRF